MNKEKQFFRIFKVDGVEYGNESFHTVVCRHTTEDEIKKEVQLLNDNYPDFSKDNEFWSYYKFEEIQILEKGDMGKNHNAPSNIKEIHMQSLKNVLTNCFDDWFQGSYDRLKTLNEEKNIKSLKERVVFLFGDYLINGLTSDDLFALIKKLKKDDKIKFDIWFLDE